MDKLFTVSVKQYDEEKDYEVYWPCTLNNPRDNSVSFLSFGNLKFYSVFSKCKNCLIFWPDEAEIPEEIKSYNHVFIKAENPHLRFCEFFEENKINSIPQKEDVDIVNGAFIAKNAKIGKNVVIAPGSYISGSTKIDDNVYIGAGVKIIGNVSIGARTVIRENTVIGADGLTTDRNKSGKVVSMPQFGGVKIGEDVKIGACTVIARGAIDDTIIESGTSIDNCTFISHNVNIGKNVLIVGETIMFGSSSIGDNSFISGNSTIRNGITIGEGCLIGMGSVVVRDVDDFSVVKGNPAK